MSRQELAGNNNQVPPGYKQTEVGVIPEDWETNLLGDVVEFLDSKRKPVKEEQRAKMRGIYPYYGASGIVDYVNDYLFDEDLILMGEDGENILSRNIRLVWQVSGKIWVNNHAHVLRPKSNFNIGFLTEYLESLDYSLYNSGTAQPKLNQQTCCNIVIALPPLPEQKAIASVLSDVDELISSLDKLIAKKRHIKTATMQQLLTGKTRLPGFGEGKGYQKSAKGMGYQKSAKGMGYQKSAKGMGYQKSAIGLIPEDWEVKQIHQIIEVDPENLISKTHPDYEFKYISLEDVNNGYLSSYSNQTFSKAPSRARRILRYQDILFATVRPNLKSHLFFNKNESDWICSTGFAVLRCKENQSSSGFIFAYLFGRAITSQIETLISGSNYPAVNNNDVKHLKILLPPLPEQKAIASVLSDMDKEIAALEKRRAKTQAIKQGMMQELLTGRTRLIKP